MTSCNICGSIRTAVKIPQYNLVGLYVIKPPVCATEGVTVIHFNKPRLWDADEFPDSGVIAEDLCRFCWNWCVEYKQTNFRPNVKL